MKKLNEKNFIIEKQTKNQLFFIEEKENIKEIMNCDVKLKQISSQKSRSLNKTMFIKILNFVNTLEEIRLIKLKQSIIKVKESTKNHKHSKIRLNPIIQIVNFLKNNCQKKFLYLAFAEIKTVFWENNRKNLQKKYMVFKLWEKLEKISRISYKTAFKNFKEYAYIKKSSDIKKIYVKNLVRCLKGIQKEKIKFFLEILIKSIDYKEKKTINYEKSFKIIGNWALIKKISCFQEIKFYAAKIVCFSEFHKTIVLLALKLAKRIKNDTFFLIKNWSSDNLGNEKLNKNNENIINLKKYFAKAIAKKIKEKITFLQQFSFHKIKDYQNQKKIIENNTKEKICSELNLFSQIISRIIFLKKINNFKYFFCLFV